MRKLLHWTVNCFYSFGQLIVLFHRSQTDNFSSFSVKYIFISFFSKSSFKCLLYNSLPLSTHRYCGSSFLNVSVPISTFLSFNGSIQPYLLKTSRTVSRYRYPLFQQERHAIFHQLAWLAVACRRIKLRFIVLFFVC